MAKRRIAFIFNRVCQNSIKNQRKKNGTSISLIIDGKEHQFEGIVEGEILTQRQGEKGFGYDPIFKPSGYNKSFAELSMDEKNSISHRGKAVEKLIQYLSNLDNQ